MVVRWPRGLHANAIPWSSPVDFFEGSVVYRIVTAKWVPSVSWNGTVPSGLVSMKIRRILVIGTSLYVAGGYVVARAQAPVLNVVTAVAETRDAPASITLVGTLMPARSSRIGAEVAGLVRDMPVRQGDRVAAGEVLCRLDADKLTHQLDEAKARLGALRSLHAELVAGTRSEDLARWKAVLDEAVAENERWKFEMNRIEGLYAGSVSNAKEFQDTRASFLMAERRRIAAQADYEKGVSGPRKEAIEHAAFEVAAQAAIVARLESELKKTIIPAPFTGAVTKRLVEVGEWVSEGGAIAEIAELATVLVHVDAPESAFPYLHIGDAARVHVDALQRSLDGRIRHVIPQADAKARTIPVEVELDNTDGLLAAGMFARATVPSGPKQQVITVPKDAVVERGGTPYVGVVMSDEKGGHSGMLMPVTLGSDVDRSVAITSGNLEVGAAVVIRGTERLMPFPTPVQLVDEMGRPIAQKQEATPTPAERGPT